MKRANESSEQSSKHQKTENEWRDINNKLHKKHREEYGFSIGSTKLTYPYLTVDDHQAIPFGVVIFPENRVMQNVTISDIEYASAVGCFEKWLTYSIDLKRHWIEEASYVEKLMTPVEFNESPDRSTLNRQIMRLFLKVSEIPLNSWFLCGRNLLYYPTHLEKPSIKGSLLRNLKLDRKLPIQDLFCYLATAFNVSQTISESLFWCNCKKDKHPVESPTMTSMKRFFYATESLVWNCI